MIMARNEDGTYSQVGFVKDNVGIDTEYIYDKDGDIVFEKGFTRETSGTVPLTINGIGKDLKAWSITGNTVQNGTPTPENPVEVQAVGDRTGNLYLWNGNLLGSSGLTVSENESVISSVVDVRGINTVYFTGDETLLNSSTYRISKSDTPIEVGSTVKTFDSSFVGGVYDVSDCNYLLVTASVYGKPQENREIIKNTFMLNEGSTALPYEPYGYKIPVVTRGKNLLEPIGFSAQGIANINDYRIKTNNNGTSLSTVYGGSVLVTQANHSGTSTSYMNGYFCIAVDFSKFTTGKNYILSFDYEIKEKHSEQVNSIAYIGSATNFTNISGDWSKDGRKSVTFTVKEGFNPYIEIRLCGNSIFVSNIQIEEGTTATPYEAYHEPITTPIYLDSPLYKIEGYADRLSTTEEVRVVKELVLTGEENFSYDDTYTRFTLKIPNARATSNRSDETPCTHYISIHDGRSIYDVPDDSIYVTVGGGYVYINIKDITYTSLADFKSYLAAQYAAGTPVKVYYVMQTPETKPVEPVQIPTLNGTTVIDVDTAVKPTEMYTKYKSSK